MDLATFQTFFNQEGIQHKTSVPLVHKSKLVNSNAHSSKLVNRAY